MSTIFTSDGGTITPTLILGYESTSDAQTIRHQIPGREAEDFTLRPHGPRTGVWSMLFAGDSAEGDSAEAEQLLRGGTVWTAVSDERDSISMLFAVTGPVKRTLDPDTRDEWTVTAEWTEDIT